MPSSAARTLGSVSPSLSSMDAMNPCPLVIDFANQITSILAPPSPQSEQDYYDKLVGKTSGRGIRIKQSKKLGKGVFANKGFKEGELVLKDEILAAAQHSSNKVDCFVCSHCFCFIGSVELQIGRRLYLQNMGSTKEECHHETISSTSEEDCPREFVDGAEEFDRDHSRDVGSSACQNLTDNPLSEEVLESLMTGDLSLPYSKQFSLPPVFACPGGCKEEHYCSKLCADSDWELFHSLFCTGEGVESSRRDALFKFVDHANSTNDIFILAAKVISYTILKYRKLKRQHVHGSKGKVCTDDLDVSNFSLLLEAWKPVSMGFKRRWWDCIALPDDIDICDEASFRMQIRDLAFASLQLLKDAIFDEECAPLFSLEIYGNIIGMFELNNLDLVVGSPVEDYFIYIDDLQSPEKEEAEKLTKPFLDALGDKYSVCCQGTAFFPLQSCTNHSCCPNAKAFKRDEDRDGRAVIIATKPIAAEEEITISYIDEDLPFEERQTLLADYGFRCACQKCVEEQP